MKSIDELIEELCPDSVEYKPLGDLGDFYGGLTGKCKVDFGNGNAKFISYMNVYSNPATKLEVPDTVKVGQFEKQNQIQHGDVLFTGSSETPEECAMSSVVTTDVMEPIYLNSFCFGFRLFDKSLYLPDFLKHLLRGEATRKQLCKTANGVTRFNVSKLKMAKVTIPILPITIQKEIVQMLDGFTGLIDELKEELSARRKQYELYRDKLLTFGDEIVWCELGDEADVTKLAGFEFSKYVKYQKAGSIIALRGLNVKHGHLVLDDVKYIDNSDLSMLTRSKLQKGDLMFTYVGTVGQVALVDSDNKYYLAPNVARIRFCGKRVLPEFMNQYFQGTQFLDVEMKKRMGSSSMDNLTMGNVRKFKIPLPSLPEQRRIVEILDKFDALCNDETAGLVAEIAARKKQYEYYRDKLLTFKRKAS